MELEIPEEEGQFLRKVSSPSRREAGDDLGEHQIRTSRGAKVARRGSQVDDHPEQSFYTS